MAIVEMLKGKSNLVSRMPSDEVYKSLNIWVGNGGFGDSNNIENAIVCFKVEKSWIQDKKIDRSYITLNRYNDGKWNPLSTNLSEENDKYVYFTAGTPGFSPFAITGKTTADGTGIQPTTGTKTQTEPNNGSAAANNEQIPEQTSKSNISGKENTKTPAFKISLGIICLICVFWYKRRQQE
jgi:hypothetical protein